MSIDTLDWLTVWYQSNCDDEWEHGFGVTIGTIDNPGWSLRIDLDHTPMAGLVYEDTSLRIDEDEENDDWWSCSVRDNKFEGACGPLLLGTLIENFRQWVVATGNDVVKL